MAKRARREYSNSGGNDSASSFGGRIRETAVSVKPVSDLACESAPDTLRAAMFESLSNRLQRVFKELRGEGHLTEFHVDEALKEIRTALLEADVNLSVVKDFTAAVGEKAVGQEVLTSFSPAQQVIKIVRDELTAILGGQQAPLAIKKRPSVILLVGLQGSGKTTTAAKLALHLKKGFGKQVLLDPRRRAAPRRDRAAAQARRRRTASWRSTRKGRRTPWPGRARREGREALRLRRRDRRHRRPPPRRRGADGRGRAHPEAPSSPTRSSSSRTR